MSSERAFEEAVADPPGGPGPPLKRRFRRVPFIQQTTPSDCGAACLAMVLACHGRVERLDDIRNVTGYGRDGTNAQSLLEAARRFGLRGRGLRIEHVEDLRLLPRGSILHWRFDHFLVFDRWTRKGLAVVDPAAGRRVISLDLARRDFTGVALTLEPSEGFAATSTPRSRTWSYLRRFAGHSGLLWKVLIVSMSIQLFALALPILVGLVVDEVVPRRDLDLLGVIGSGLAGLVVFYLLASLTRSHLLLFLRTRLETELTLDFLEHLFALPFSFFERRTTGDLMMRLNSNATIREILTSSLLTSLLDGVLVTGYLVVLLIASPRIGLLTLGLGALRVAVFLVSRKRHRELTSETLMVQAASQSYQVQMLAGIETLKSSGAEERALDRWSNLFVDTLNVALAKGRLNAWTDGVLDTLAIASPLVVLCYGSVLVLRGELSLGTMLAANALAVGFLQPLSNLVASSFQLQNLGSYLDRIHDVLETPREQVGRHVRTAPRLAGRIELEAVTFRYSPRSRPAVQDLSVVIEPAMTVAVVGRSGAGKSTLGRLLVGLYRPDSGRVLFDGVPLEELEPRSLRRQLGVVAQHPYLFGQSIRANIALTDPAAPLERIVQAARRAAIHDEIASLPMGYETLLSDGGGSLSGGQRQRIAIARALVHEPRILLLDEATSALDAVTEARVQQELSTLCATRIVIAHRLSSVRHADLILVMDQGMAVEHGRHRDLVRLGGLYAELVREQLETAEASGEPGSSDELRR
jgi:ABC-type bacteriocin/lantibiotic exporter with double-glycine peptidase domain